MQNKLLVVTGVLKITPFAQTHAQRFVYAIGVNDAMVKSRDCTCP